MELMSRARIGGNMDVGFRVIGLLFLVTNVAVAEMRTWTFEQSGTTMRGEVVGFTGDAVTLKHDDGKIVSVRISYLNESDRTYLAAERAKQWKEVEVVRLDGTASPAQYKKCSVRGGGVQGEILIGHLSPAVEAILNKRNQQATQISNLTAQIDSQQSTLQEANAAIPSNAAGNRAYRRAVAAERAQANQESKDLKTSQANLAKLQKAYDDSVKKTKNEPMVKMRNTGVVYQRLPVWECFDPRKPPE
jgi:hypothetical protein